MYSHKRSFTGHSSRSLAVLLDAPFLLFVTFLAALFSFAHSAVIYFKLHDHVRSWPDALTQLPESVRSDILKKSSHILNFELILSTWLGLVIPLFVFAIAIRWTLASLRVAVQRAVTSGLLLIFYFLSYMTIALATPDWTPGNPLVQFFSHFGAGLFQSLRAIICLAVLVACILTLLRNATSRIDRNTRLILTSVLIVGVVAVDYSHSHYRRTVHPSFLKAPVSLRFIYVIPGLRVDDLQKSLRALDIKDLKPQLSSFQEILPSTPSVLGQFATSMLGVYPHLHGIRHDYVDPEILPPTWRSLSNKAFAKSTWLSVSAIGGSSPLEAFVAPSTPGHRCGQTPKHLARVGHFQASVIPYALTPRLLEPYLNEELLCSNRFLSLQQHLLNSYDRVMDDLHSPGVKTFVIWVSPHLKTDSTASDTQSVDQQNWENRTYHALEVLKSHQAFLTQTKLIQFHQTFVVGLATEPATTTAFARFDGQSSTEFTDLTLDSPGLQSQTFIAEQIRSEPVSDLKTNAFFYSEFTDTANEFSVGRIAPEVTVNQKEHGGSFEFIVNQDTLRKNIVNSKRQVMCQNILSAAEPKRSVKVSLNLQSNGTGLPALVYDEFDTTDRPLPENRISLTDCLTRAREILTDSVSSDASLRDSSAFRTLLTGLPVKSIKAQTSGTESSTSSDAETEDVSMESQRIPDSPDEEAEE